MNEMNRLTKLLTEAQQKGIRKGAISRALGMSPELLRYHELKGTPAVEARVRSFLTKAGVEIVTAATSL